MEVLEYIQGGYCRAGNPQFPHEKQAKAAGAGDQFAVEDLLDFSNEDDGFGEDEGVLDAAVGNSADSSNGKALDSCSNSSFSGCDPHFSGTLACRSFADTSLSGELCVPYDELAELEWLSNFVEDSFSSEELQKLQLISGVKSSPASETRSEISNVAVKNQQGTLFRRETPVPGKARSKRSRAAPCSWSSRLLVLSPSTASSDSETVIPPANSTKKVPKPPKKKDDYDVLSPVDGRKCLHCATDKTPQWRTGPMGPKTLCNACGVRYKSGRLVPEYRPAASPTFVLSKHSNSHRKVLELRRQKELQEQHPQHPFLHSCTNYEAPSTVGDGFLIHHQVGPDFRQLI